MGFNVVDVVGGISYSDDIGRWVTPLTPIVGPSPVLCWPLRAKRLPEQYREKMGRRACRRVGLSLSYDKGEANGVWASLAVIS